MDTATIKLKTISGAKWLIILSLLTFPLNYSINIILGRISPEALGAFGELEVIVGICQTFVMFASGASIIRYIPRLQQPEKLSFFLKCLTINFSLAVFFVILVLLFPHFIKKIIPGLDDDILKFFILFIPVTITIPVLISTLNGLMELKLTAFIQKILVLGNFIIFGICYVFFHDYFQKNYRSVIYFSYFLMSLLSLSSGLIALIKKIEKNIQLGSAPFWPKGFIGFALFNYSSGFLVFLSLQVDKIIILNKFTTRELGLYLAPMKTILLIMFFSRLLGQVLLPAFSNLISKNDIAGVKKGYSQAVRYNILVMIPLLLFIIIFSEKIILLFGREFLAMDNMLVLLALFYSFNTLAGINHNLILASGKSATTFFNSLFQVSLQIILMIYFIKEYGVFGIALGRGIGLFFSQMILIYIVKFKLCMRIKIPKAYFWGGFSSILAVMYTRLSGSFLLLDIFAFLLLLFFFLIISGYNKNDLKFISCTILKRDGQKSC